MRMNSPEDQMKREEGVSGQNAFGGSPGLTAVPRPDIPAWTDEELMVHVHDVEGAFQELVVRYERSIFLLSVSMLNSRADAEEVTQETFLAIYKNAHRFDPAKTFSPWLYTIASNQCKNVLRRRKRKIYSLDVEGFPEVRSREELDPKVLYENEMSEKLLAEAVSSLKPKYSIVLMLRYAEACSYEEIGTHLGLSMKAVDTRLYRAKKQLRRKLELLGIKENPF